MKKRYEALIEAAGELWTGSGEEEVTMNPEYIRGQIETISDAFGVEQEQVREDILDAAGIWRDLRWDGARIPAIASETNPWIQDEHGLVFSFGGDGEVFRELMSGVLVSDTAIQADDNAGMSQEFTDLHAARIAAHSVSQITGRKHEVWFHGSY